MSTVVTTYTYSHSATYVTDQILRSLSAVVRHLGLDHRKLIGDWEVIDEAINTWLHSGHLQEVILEIYEPYSGSLVYRWDYPIEYAYRDEEGNMWVDLDAIQFAIAKSGSVPAECLYRVICSVQSGHPPVVRWGPTQLRSTEGFAKYNIGTIVGTHEIGARASYWRRQ